MTRRRLPWPAAALGGAALALGTSARAPVFAVTPRIWIEDTSGVMRGESDSLAFSPRGGIVLAPRPEPILPPVSPPPGKGEESPEALSEPVIWCSDLEPTGNLLVGTGHSGRLLRLSAAGAATVLAQMPEPEVTAVLASRSGDVYAATSPNGAVYRIGKDGEPVVFFEPEERYIWALAEDAAGSIYAGTGEHGKIFRISREGTGKIVYDSPEPQITCLTFDRTGSLLAGSDGTGAIYRIDAKDHAVVLYDSDYREIADLVVDPAGRIYAAAVSAGAGAIPPPVPRLRVLPSEDEGRILASSDEVTHLRPTPRHAEREPMEAEIEGLSPAGAPQDPARERGGAILRISMDGVVEEMWQSRKEIPYALVVAADGSLFAGTGEPARLLRLGEAGKAVVLAQFPQGQLSDLQSDRSGRLFATTSNSGSAWRIPRELAASGTYQSPVRDAGANPRWGLIRWEAEAGSGQKVEIQTRSGNSSIPDETWAGWSTIYNNPGGSTIASPPARYVQWRARLERADDGSSSPLLRSVSISYLPRNQPPRVREARILSRAEGRPSSSNAGSAEDPAKTLRSVIWHAQDPDDDSLAFEVLLQKEGEAAWKPAGTVKGDSPFVFDESGWPEGRYRAKVLASDGPSNVPGEALGGESVSDLAVIDHSPPELKTTGGGGAGPLEVLAADAWSPIQSAEILCGDRPVAAARPVDGVLDSLREKLQPDLRGAGPCGEILGSGVSGYRLRVRDAAGNETMIGVSP